VAIQEQPSGQGCATCLSLGLCWYKAGPEQPASLAVGRSDPADAAGFSLVEQVILGYRIVPTSVPQQDSSAITVALL